MAPDLDHFVMMIKKNQTLITEFLLLGFGDLQEFRILVFIIFFNIYIMALISNVLVVTLVVFNKSLQSPMYIFISQLSLSEIIFTSNIVPNMLWLILMGGGRVSTTRCIFQFFVLAFPTVVQCLLLGTMSFDRYVAICQPLHYTLIMTFEQQVQIITSCWLLGFTASITLYALLNRLQFCGPYIINHYYCNISPIVELSCSENSLLELITSVLCFVVLVCPFLLIVVTYVSILHTILNISSTTGRKKAFSTCSSHLIIVCLYYGSLGSISRIPSKEKFFNTNKGLSLLFTLITPLVNPLIYSLRNQEMRCVITKCIHFLQQISTDNSKATHFLSRAKIQFVNPIQHAS